MLDYIFATVLIMFVLTAIVHGIVQYKNVEKVNEDMLDIINGKRISDD